jgi:hypothetical protein
MISISDNTFRGSKPGVKYLQYSDAICRSQGFINATLTIGANGRPLSWDKALLHFCVYNKIKYQHVWLIEDDVLIPTKDTLRLLDLKYPDADLLSRSHGLNTTGELNWHWKQAQGKIALPWANSMVCAVRVSPKLLLLIQKLATQKRSLLFIEFMFNTIALHHKLSVQTPPELSGILWRHVWTEENATNPLALYHPVKNVADQSRLRAKLQSSQPKAV